MQRLSYLGLVTLATATLGGIPSASAAEEVVLKYRGLSRSVPVADLAILADTGEAPESVAGLLDQAGQTPEELQALLVRPLAADPVILDQALNSWPGEWALDQLGEAIHPTAGEAQRQALRAALIESATGDNQVTLLEVLEAYPTPEVVLEGDRIEAAYTQLATFLEPLSILF
ncbi:MAG: alpha/beta hydrolase [Nodosilinea sp.]